MNLED